WHLRRIAAAPPRSDSTVVAVARDESMTAFDRARPLWRFTLVEGLSGDRAALVMKVHHSLTDGLGGMQLMLTLFDPVVAGTSALAADPSRVEPPAGEVLGPVALGRDIVAHRAGRGARAIRGGLATVPSSVGRGARDPIGLSADAVRTAWSVGRTVAPVRETMSPVMRRRGLGRELGMVEVALDDLKRAGARAECSVNDAFLAA